MFISLYSINRSEVHIKVKCLIQIIRFYSRFFIPPQVTFSYQVNFKNLVITNQVVVEYDVRERFSDLIVGFKQVY